MYVWTKMHENCTGEYTLGAMLTGTFSVAAVPVLHGTTEAVPNASLPIVVMLLGSVMLVRTQEWKAKLSIILTPVGMLILDSLVQP